MNFSANIRPHVERELRAAGDALAPDEAFHHLERAHVLGQASTGHHVRVHWRMFLWGWRQRDFRECAGQLLRIAGAATKTAIGLVPAGNTGGANVSPFKPMPLDPDLAAIIAAARGIRN